jgi:hypothetical protein
MPKGIKKTLSKVRGQSKKAAPIGGGENTADVHSKAILNAKKYPHAAALNKELLMAKKLKKAPTPASFKAGELRPKKLTALEWFAEYTGESRLHAILDKILEMAAAGDTVCMGYAIDRLVPKGKVEGRIYSSIGMIRTLVDVSEGMTTVLEEVSKGQITDAAGETMFKLLSQKQHTIALALEDRISKLEVVQEGKKL